MREPGPYTETKPVITPALRDEIAGLLEITSECDLEHLGNRLQRYADQYFVAFRRQQIIPLPGELKIDAAQIVTQAGKLVKLLRPFAMSDRVQGEYTRARRQIRKGRKPSIDGLKVELSALRHISESIAKSPPLQSGAKGRAILRHAVGAIMALFEHLTGRRVQVTSYDSGITGCFLKGPEGKALLMFFESLDPRIEAKTLGPIYVCDPLTWVR